MRNVLLEICFTNFQRSKATQILSLTTLTPLLILVIWSLMSLACYFPKLFARKQTFLCSAIFFFHISHNMKLRKHKRTLWQPLVISLESLLTYLCLPTFLYTMCSLCHKCQQNFSNTIQIKNLLSARRVLILNNNQIDLL